MRVYTSAHADIEIPALDLTTFLFESPHCTAQESTKIHIEAANPAHYITKAEARDAVKRISHLLRHRFSIGASGAGKDVVLSTCSGNPFIPILVYSIIAAGGVYSGAPTSFTVNELVRQVQDADAKVLLCSSECEATTVAAAKQCDIPLDRILILDCGQRPRNWRLIRASDRTNILDLLSGPQHEWTRITTVKDLESTTACLLYSSGTTGLPKGVLISHRNLVASTCCAVQFAKRYIAQHQQQTGTVFTFSKIAHLPMAHIGGVTWSSLYPFCLGGTAYWIEKYEFDSFIRYHRQYRLTSLWTVPPIWLAIANSGDVTDHFDSVRVAITGAAPMGAELTARAAARLGRGSVRGLNSLWGATETTGSMTGLDWTAVDDTSSVGLPFPNMKVRIVDEQLQDVEPGQPGELLVSGPVVCQGYHNRPLANKSSFTSNNYYLTGDVALFSPATNTLHIVDRLKELIKYKGLQVAPAELEALLTSHPRIADAAVVGVYSERIASEVPRAFVVRSAAVGGTSRGAAGGVGGGKQEEGQERGTELSEEEVQAFVRENLARHKWLRGGVVFVGEIPKSASGKILRKVLRGVLQKEEEGNGEGGGGVGEKKKGGVKL